MIRTKNSAAYASSQKNAVFSCFFLHFVDVRASGKWLFLLLVPFIKTFTIFLLTCSCLTLYLFIRYLVLHNNFHLSLKCVPNILIIAGMFSHIYLTKTK